ncbi:hypothetical protein ABTK75_20405, partial [Acinetobacter baumannii]
HPDRGVIPADGFVPAGDRPLVLIVFYRAYLAAHDLDPFVALHAALERRGFATLSIFAPSLKAPEVRAQVAEWVRRV